MCLYCWIGVPCNGVKYIISISRAQTLYHKNITASFTDCWWWHMSQKKPSFKRFLNNPYAKIFDLSREIPVSSLLRSIDVCGRLGLSFSRTAMHCWSSLREFILVWRSSLMRCRFCSNPSSACLQDKKINQKPSKLPWWKQIIVLLYFE